MTKVFIAEGEVVARKSLIMALSQYFPDLEIVGTAASVKEAALWLRDNRPDVIFMDVVFPDGICFDIFSQVDVLSGVIMITTYDNCVIKAFDAGRLNYILKPIDTEQLKRSLARFCNNGGRTSRKKYKERYIVRFNDRIVPLRVSNIAYVFSEDKNNYMVTFDGQKYIIDSSLETIRALLDPKSFFRISRGCIISIKAIDTIFREPGGRLRITAHPLPPFVMTVSRSRVEGFLSWLET